MDCPHSARPGRTRRVTWLPVLLAWLLAVAGCGPLLLSSPQIQRLHAVDVVAPSTQVRAFHIDVERSHPETRVARDSSPASESAVAPRWRFTAVPIPEDGRMPAKTFITWRHPESPEHRAQEPGGFLSRGFERAPSTRLRLYRPGFQTVEILPWQRVDRIEWEPATDLAARERAIDELLCSSDADGSDAVSTDLEERAAELLLEPWEDALRTLGDRQPKNLPRHERLWPLAFGHLCPGTVSEDHRRALEFAAFEYERLADQPFAEGPQPEKLRDRVRAKSAWLRGLASGRKPPVP